MNVARSWLFPLLKDYLDDDNNDTIYARVQLALSYLLYGSKIGRHLCVQTAVWQGKPSLA